MTDLAAIVARDAAFLDLAPLEGGQSPTADLILDGYRDRRALLTLLRETRDALAGVMLPGAWKPMTGTRDAWITLLSTQHIERLRAHLAALDPLPSPADRSEATS